MPFENSFETGWSVAKQSKHGLLRYARNDGLRAESVLVDIGISVNVTYLLLPITIYFMPIERQMKPASLHRQQMKTSCPNT